MEGLIFLALVAWSANVIMVGWLAEQKGRDGLSWVLLAIPFGLMATFWLAIAPTEKR